MNKFIVTTTISSPTEATLKFANMEGWTLIVVGDLKTPHEEYEKLNCVYLSPEYQETEYPELSDAIGWKCIQRRNIGFVEAYRRGADVVATVDDDNIPYDGWGENLLVGQEIDVDCYSSENGVFDPLSVTNINHLRHRGYPSEHIATKNDITYEGKVKRQVLVQADLWDGDPDIDAMARISYRPEIKIHNIEGPYCSINLAPFNSQNTFLHRDVLPHYMVIPHIERMDDIWGGYMLQHIFRDCLIYNQPTVYQERNEHDLVTDLEGELIGLRHTMKVIKGDYSVLPEKAMAAYKIYKKQFNLGHCS